MKPTLKEINKRLFDKALVESPQFTRIGGELLWQVMTHPTTNYFLFEHGQTVSGLNGNAGAVFVATATLEQESGVKKQCGDNIKELLTPAGDAPLKAVTKDVAVRLEVNTVARTLTVLAGTVTIKGSGDEKGKPIKGSAPLPDGAFSLSLVAGGGVSVELSMDASRARMSVEGEIPTHWRLEEQQADKTTTPVEEEVDVSNRSVTLALRELCLLMQVEQPVWQQFCEDAGKARDHVERLKKYPLFAGVTDKGLGGLLNQPAVQFREVKSGEVLCREGSFDTTAFFIVNEDGRVRVTQQRDGKEEDIGEMAGGDFFGEIAALSLRKRTATVQALTDCVLLEIDGRPLRKGLNDKSLEGLRTDMQRKYVQRGFKDELYEESIFAALDPTQVELQDVTFRSYKKNDVILKEGTGEGGFHIVQKGTVIVTRKGFDGRDRTLAVLEEGMYFGHISVVLDIPPTATVTALDKEVETACLTPNAFRSLFQSDPEVWSGMERAAQASLGVGVPPPPATDSPQDALAQAPHFKDLPMSVINGLRARLVDFVPTPTATEDQQSILCQQGQDSSHVYYLVRGYVQVSRRDEASREERLVAHLAPGMWVGEIGLLTGQGVHTTTAKAATEVRVVEISSVDYLTALQSATAVETAARQEAAARFAVWRGAQTSAQRAQEFVAQQRLLAARHLRVVDLEKCIRCGNCMTACAAAHDDGIARFGWTPQPPSKVDEPLQWLPTLRMETAPPLLFPGSCRHCEDAPCLFPCPTSAITRGRNHEGEVHVIAERCIGCSGCEASCPFGAIQMRPRPRPADKAPTPAGVFAWLTRLMGGDAPTANGQSADGYAAHDTVSVKCDLCRGREFQACVQHCPVGAVVCVEDPQSLDEILLKVIGRQPKE